MNTFTFKILVLIVLISDISKCLPETNGWELLDIALPTDRRMYNSLKCSDPLNCIAWGGIGGNWGFYFRKTTDGGKIWENKYLDSSYFKSSTDYRLIPVLKEIAYPNHKLFIAVGDSGFIIRSTDNGETWKKFTYMKNKFFFKVRMYDENYGIALCSTHDSTISEPHFTFDGGQTWVKMNYPQFIERTYIYDYQIINKNLFVASIKPPGNKYYLLWVKGNWEEWHLDSLYKLFPNLFFLNEFEGWISGGKVIDSNGTCTQIIQHTTNSGKNWETQRDIKYNGAPINGLSFFDKNHGFAVSNFSCYLETTNGGRNWYPNLIFQPPNDNKVLRDLQQVSNNSLFVIVDMGTIYKYTRDLSGPQNHEPAVPSKPEGSLTDSVYLDYTYQTKTNDPDGDSVKYYFDWGDGKFSEWTKLYFSGEQISVSHSWDTTGSFHVRVKARDKDEMESEWSDAITVKVIGQVKPQNRPPETPSKPVGSIVDSIYKSYNYMVSAKDPDGDSLSYYFDWGDSSISGWTDYYPSDSIATSSHQWEQPGEFIIKVRAKDTKESQSNWSDTIKIEVVGKTKVVEENVYVISPEIYPNPTNDIIRIKSNSRIKNVKILNVYGETVKGISDIYSEEIEIAIGALPSGLYQIIIQDDKQTFFRKLIKM